MRNTDPMVVSQFTKLSQVDAKLKRMLEGLEVVRVAGDSTSTVCPLCSEGQDRCVRAVILGKSLTITHLAGMLFRRRQNLPPSARRQIISSPLLLHHYHFHHHHHQHNLLIPSSPRYPIHRQNQVTAPSKIFDLVTPVEKKRKQI